MEFGPRALGNRSLLGDPRDSGIRATLNAKVKHRESFRPLRQRARRHASDWFDLGRRSINFDYMSVAVPVLPESELRESRPSSKTESRDIQIVDGSDNPRFSRLISEFAQITGVPILLNTSFNDSEPIVCTPQDAIKTFLLPASTCLRCWAYIIVHR